MTKKVVLEMMNKTLHDRDERQISRCTFYKIWRTQFCNVKTPSKQQMSKCKACDDFKNAIKHSKCEQLRGRYIKWRAIYLHHVQDAKKLYAS